MHNTELKVPRIESGVVHHLESLLEHCAHGIRIGSCVEEIRPFALGMMPTVAVVTKLGKRGLPRRVCTCGRELYGPPEWWILVYGWQGNDNRPWRLLHTLCTEAANAILSGQGKGDTPLSSCFIHLAERESNKCVLDWSTLNGEPWLPGWRPLREADRWWAVVRLGNVLNLSAKAVQQSTTESISPAVPGRNEGGAPRADAYTDLRKFANSELKGQERAVIEALCGAAGQLPIADLAVRDGVGWGDPFQGFKDVQRRLNRN